MKTTATIQADNEQKTIRLSVAEQTGDTTSENSQTAKITAESRLHARKWIAAQFEMALRLIDEA